jgi:hypothetical protein
MQIRSELTALAPQRLTWKLPQHRRRDNASENRHPGAVTLTGLRTAQREVLKDNRVEEWVWIGLAFTSLAVIVVSFWP